MKEPASLFGKNGDSHPPNPDRISFFQMLLFHVYAYPLYVRLKNSYKSGPIIPSKMASAF
jgi:hypothetical protein